ncbi:hypothetical protein [Aliarcobacter butzleri]|uniref:hypothetical protein n=1 Tax=Aliarcobacter butzleri TaxID=28197 RepID=UPI00263D1C28|nr:hypothetical protein [Aliarcobacter butzleri]MDN5089850.1 hypothetical protein [Aliarcobacter butzleri]
MIPKGNFKAIYNVTDTVSSGLLTNIKNSIVNTYKGYFEDKFNELMSDLFKNKITEEEILEWVKKLGNTDKDIYFSILNKNLLSETKIKRFLLSKILFHKVRSEKIDYFHSTLLTSLDLFNEIDFTTIYNISLQPTRNNNQITFKIKDIDKSYVSTIQKITSIGFINGNLIDGGGLDDSTYTFHVLEYYFKLEELLKEYFHHISKTDG